MKINIKKILNKNKLIFFYLLIISVILYFSLQTKIRENFEWTKKSTNYFLKTQELINPTKIFDVELLQKQNNITQDNLSYFNKNKKWEWTNETQELYKNSVKKNPYIKTNPQDSLNYAMTIYDEASILKTLSNMAKEGDFLLSGVLVPGATSYPDGVGDFGYNSGLIENNMKDIIKCNLDKGYLERTSDIPYYGIFGEKQQIITPVNYQSLENIIPGFSFIDEPCNPCKNMANNINSKKCKFLLKTKKQPEISDVWKYIWYGNKT